MAEAEDVIATFLASKHKREEDERLFSECLRDRERHSRPTVHQG